MALVGFIWRDVHHYCTMSVRGGYVAMHEFDIDGAEQKICRGCVDELCMGSKPNKLKKVQHSTVYRTEESEEDKEEVEGTVLGGGGGDVTIVPIVYPRGTVSVSSLGSFFWLALLLNLLILFCLSLSEHATSKSISIIRGGGDENSLSHSSRSPGMRSG